MNEIPLYALALAYLLAATVLYLCGCLIGYALEMLIKAIWPPRPPTNTKRFHIFKP
jgi:hypothetical protein